ncbi:TRAP transporter large permease subunit, partial [Bordetella bronchiseptica]|uniref:TRAP transporter large permease subunit n=1 Tax=Bordetella bronchiseptica TaxID=518 RepID=UPI00389A4BEC
MSSASTPHSPSPELTMACVMGSITLSVDRAQAKMPALFAAGMVPGILAGFALIIPAVWLARRHGMGAREAHLPRPPLWDSLREASWGLAAPVLIL